MFHTRNIRDYIVGNLSLEAQLPIYWVPFLKPLYDFMLSVTQGPTIWVPGLLGFHVYITLRVQVPNNHILTQNLYYNYNYPKPKFLIIGYMDPKP